MRVFREFAATVGRGQVKSAADVPDSIVPCFQKAGFGFMEMDAIQNALLSVLHHLEDAEHTTDPEYRSGSLDDAEEAAAEGLGELPPMLSLEPLESHYEEELEEPEHEEPHEAFSVGHPDEKGEARKKLDEIEEEEEELEDEEKEAANVRTYDCGGKMITVSGTDREKSETAYDALCAMTGNIRAKNKRNSEEQIAWGKDARSKLASILRNAANGAREVPARRPFR